MAGLSGPIILDQWIAGAFLLFLRLANDSFFQADLMVAPVHRARHDLTSTIWPVGEPRKAPKSTRDTLGWNSPAWTF